MPGSVQPADTTFSHAVAEAIRATQITDADGAAVLLAQRLALLIDNADDEDAALYRHGPRLLQVLAALRCTPAARGEKAPATAGGGKLAQLRAVRGGAA